MSNDYYNFLSPLVSGSTARSADVNDEFDLVAAGFQLVQNSIEDAQTQTEANSIGAGFANPILTIGDASSTSASVYLRSATGSQAYDTRIVSSGGTNGSNGLGTLVLTAKTVATTGPFGSTTEYDNGNSGAAITISSLNGVNQKLTLNSATPVITFDNGFVVGHINIKVCQDGVGGRVPSFATTNFPLINRRPNPLTVGLVAAGSSGSVTFITMYWDGTAWWGISQVWI